MEQAHGRIERGLTKTTDIGFEMFPKQGNHLASKLTSSPNTPLKSVTEEADRDCSLNAGTSLGIVRHLIANRRLEVDMDIPVRPDQPLRLTAKPAILR